MSDSWDSPAARELIGELNLAPDPAAECWQGLAADIREARQANDDVRLARDLDVVRKLILLSLKDLEEQLGHDWWARVQSEIDSTDVLALYTLKIFQQLGTMAPRDVKDKLVDLGRNGFRYYSRFGSIRRWPQDCGLKAFVELSRVIPKLFERNLSASVDKVMAPASGQRGKPTITIHYKDNGIRLSYSKNGKPSRSLMLDRKSMKLVEVLHEGSYQNLATQSPKAARHLWEQLWPDEAFKTRRRSIPDRIRRLVCDVNKKLTEKFGELPQSWIERRPDTSAYVLTTHAKWKLASSSKGSLPTVDAQTLDWRTPTRVSSAFGG